MLPRLAFGVCYATSSGQLCYQLLIPKRTPSPLCLFIYPAVWQRLDNELEDKVMPLTNRARIATNRMNATILS